MLRLMPTIGAVPALLITSSNQNTTKIGWISGAAVSEQEAERITKLIPQVGDTEATFEAKLQALDSYFADAIAIAEDKNADFTTALEIMEGSGRGASNYLDLSEGVSIKQYDGNKYDVSAN